MRLLLKTRQGISMNRLVATFFIAIGVIGCQSIDKKTKAHSFSEGVRLPEKTEMELPNGLQLLFVRDTSLPRINIMALINSGAVRDPEGLSGLSYLTAGLLDEGSKKHSSAEIAEKLEGLGASLSIQPGYDFTQMTIKGLSYTRDSLLDSFIEVLLSPQFAQKEIDRIQKQMIGALQKMEDDADQYVDHLFAEVLYQKHPYARPPMGEIETLSKIKRKDILLYYEKYFTPKNIRIAVVGDFDANFIQQVKNRFSTWISDQKATTVASSSSSSSSSSSVPKENPAGFYLKNKKGLVQTQIRIGHLFVERSSPEFMSLRAANMVLGGAFASRLNQKVRDDLGLTYGASSSFDGRLFAGPFMIETFTRNDKVRDTLSATMDVFREFVMKGITQEELDAAKTTLIGQFPRAVETTESLAFQMLALRFYGIPETYLTRYIANVQDINLNHVNSILRTYFKPQHLEVVVYGDGAVINTQLQQVGPFQKL